MLRYFYLPVYFCLILAISTNVNAQLTVDNDLGTLSLGTMDISGDTATGSNQVDYFNFLDPAIVYGNENVYQFTVTETVFFNVSSVALNGDPDFFLLNGDVISTDLVGKTFAEDTIGVYFLDAGPPETGATPLVLPPGTYFLVASAFHGFDGAVVPADATYTVQISLDTPPPIPASSTNLGNIADMGVAFTIDTFGSVIADPELAIWNEDGILFLLNDAVDFAGGNLQAELDLFVGLPDGTYVVAVAGFNTAFGDGFAADGTAAEFSGDYTLNYNGQTTTGSLALGDVDFYTFTIGGTVILGDCDLNGTVNFFDIQPFIDVLSSNTFLPQADCNQDGVVDFFDIQFFIDILANPNP